jgi:hypothetical protein
MLFNGRRRSTLWGVLWNYWVPLCNVSLSVLRMSLQPTVGAIYL